MNRRDKIRAFIINYLGSNNYRILKITRFNKTYERWDVTFSLQMKVMHMFWTDVKMGYYSCEKAYEDLLKFKRIPKKEEIKHIMNKSDLIMEMLKDGDV